MIIWSLNFQKEAWNHYYIFNWLWSCSNDLIVPFSFIKRNLGSNVTPLFGYTKVHMINTKLADKWQYYLLYLLIFTIPLYSVMLPWWSVRMCHVLQLSVHLDVQLRTSCNWQSEQKLLYPERDWNKVVNNLYVTWLNCEHYWNDLKAELNFALWTKK